MTCGNRDSSATGAVLLHLPSVAKQIQTGKAQVFSVNPRAPQPEDAWEFFRLAAERRKKNPAALYNEVKVTDDELTNPVLEDDYVTARQSMRTSALPAGGTSRRRR